MRATAIRTDRGTLMAMATVPSVPARSSNSVAIFKHDPEWPHDGGWLAIASVSAEFGSSPSAALVGRIRPEVVEVLDRAAEALRTPPAPARQSCDACDGTTTGNFCHAHSWHNP